MKSSMIALCLLVWVSGCSTTSQPGEQARDELRSLKTAYWPGLYANKDADGLAAFLDDDFILIAGGKVGSKAEEVAWLRDPGDWSQPDDFAFRVIDVVLITPDAALVYGEGSSTQTGADGKTCRMIYLSSNTLRRVEGRWRPVSSHVSDARCTPFSD